MALDASIYQGIQPIQPVQQVNPLTTLAQAYQLRGLQSRTDLADQELAQHRGLADAYKGATGPDGAINRNALLSSLAGGGYGAAIPGVQKSFADQDKSGRESEKAKYEAMLKQFEVAGQIMSGVTDQPSWDRARAMTAQAFGPEKAAQMPEAYNPALIQENMQKAMAVKDQVEQKYKALTFGETQRHNQAGEANTVRGQDLSRDTALRGQDMADARAREAGTSSRIPSGYRQASDGTLEFIPGGPADPNSKAGGGKPLTEGQSKALLFGTRMKEANAVLDELAKDDKLFSTPGSRVPFGVGAAVNMVNSEKGQKLDQAKRDFLNAVLRRESGAVIAETEFANADQQYFPQPGDAAGVIAQKKRNREVAMRGILEEVPDGEARVSKVRGGAPAGPQRTVARTGTLPDGRKVVQYSDGSTEYAN